MHSCVGGMDNPIFKSHRLYSKFALFLSRRLPLAPHLSSVTPTILALRDDSQRPLNSAVRDYPVVLNIDGSCALASRKAPVGQES